MRHRGQRGQATVEFALIIPIVMVVLLAIAQVGLVIFGQLAVIHTAREVARNVAREPDIDVTQLVQEVSAVSPDELVVEVATIPSSTGTALVEVSVSYRVAPITSLFNALLNDFSVNATAVMVFEP